MRLIECSAHAHTRRELDGSASPGAGAIPALVRTVTPSPRKPASNFNRTRRRRRFIVEPSPATGYDAPVNSGQATPSASDDGSDITQILANWEKLPDPASALLPLVYEHLRAIAANRMSGERANHTLQATALVHEAYMKLVRLPGSGFVFESRARFFGAAAEAMRRILIDYARRRQAEKRAGAHVPLDALMQDPADLAQLPDPDSLLALDEALKRLADEDPRAAEVVRLRFFAGLGAEETAEVMQLSPRTVNREWTYARARLHELLRDH